jgi:hypothetical protein
MVLPVSELQGATFGEAQPNPSTSTTNSEALRITNLQGVEHAA